MSTYLLLVVLATLLALSCKSVCAELEQDEQSSELSELPNYIPGEEETLPFDSSLNLLRKSMSEEVNANQQLYDADDVETFFNGDRGLIAPNFLIHRDGDWKKAYKLAVKTLRWRARNGISKLTASDFPCDLFSLGLVMEYGKTRSMARSDSTMIPSEPVIWVRLGALGSIIKYLERYRPRSVATGAMNMFRRGRSKLSSWMSFSERHNPLQQRDPRIHHFRDQSMSQDPTIQHVLKSITWWLDNWRKSNNPGARATLVLDMENTDFAFSSKSVANFLVGLDDKFPELFDRVILYRYRSKWNSFIHSPVSMINRIFRTRVGSSMATFNKIRIVAHESDISHYIPRVDSNGTLLLPEYITGDCLGPIYEKPAGCREDSQALASETGMYDGKLWQSIYNEFYQMCKPHH